MTRFFYDFEFIEDGRTIELISVGIVAEDGREYYAVNEEMPVERIQRRLWLMQNVVPHLPLSPGGVSKSFFGDNSAPHGRFSLDRHDSRVKPRRVIANEVRDFLVGTGPEPASDVELWAYYGAYDHVLLCQLWGSMVNHPAGVPMWTNDLMQEAARLGHPKLPTQEGDEHHALADARWTRDAWLWLRSYAGQTTAPPAAGTEQVHVLSWDYREQPDLAVLGRLVAGGAVHLHQVEDTGTQDYALVVSSRPLTDAEAAEAWRRHWEGGDVDE